MLQIGLIGLGKIAEKAYLPYMRQLPDVKWHISTRDKTVRETVKGLFSSAKTYQDIDQLLAQELDGVFIHAATKVHFDLASRFLSRGIPVYMDKPATESFDTTKKLYDIAEKHDTFLMIGFNRRFAPRVLELKSLSNKKQIHVEKNDIDRPGER
ncbi:hypothetical protein HMPREF9318_00940 [Streptococcus urinalis FB127-CNA-2]|uniref:Oxidoreductase, NAD-binding domain protein n=1 Tax=Streptococcus urinalis 2285-97 TaxID=764291 RepID=G5KGS4_9STRE|nr:oxidoreductase, NAD-binding domain protein [Streptococcus urinalis 2285-97]EKS20986.1 hypothetical protein HMPREF9318_00940 [Streptococcus urinalis FB127-CNA-2]VEF30995.1 oxidoreductase Mvi-like protein [Streptococcus urinalis]